MLPIVWIQRPLGFVLLIDAAMTGAKMRVKAVTKIIGDATNTNNAVCKTACHHQMFKTTVFTASNTLAEAPTVPASLRKTTCARSISYVVADHATSLDIYPMKDSTTWMKTHYAKHTTSRTFGVRTQIADDQRRRERANTVPSMSAKLESVQRREAALEVLTAISVRYANNHLS